MILISYVRLHRGCLKLKLQCLILPRQILYCLCNHARQLRLVASAIAFNRPDSLVTWGQPSLAQDRLVYCDAVLKHFAPARDKVDRIETAEVEHGC